MIECRLHEEDISLEMNPDNNNGLAIAFALNYTRLNADVERDLKKGACLSSSQTQGPDLSLFFHTPTCVS